MRLLTVALLALTFVFVSNASYSQSAPPKPLCSIHGTITAEGAVLPFATVSIKSTTLGTASGADGDYELYQVPAGEYIVRVQALGYKPLEKAVVFQSGTPVQLNVELESDVLGLEQIVVTADRNERKRSEASTIVNTLSPKLLENTQAVTISEGLAYCPGLRMENNCQNCGFTQLRMNGLEGPYSQILVNSRPIFSGLAGVYGLELIPANMIDRIEVIRGGGSALYGSNAIAGTVNLITKDPISNSYEVKMQHNSIGVGTGSVASDYAINFNTSLVSEDKNTGIALFGFNREKEPYDANGDGFSEASDLENLTFGARLFHRPGYRSKLTADFFRINEKRRGGNKFDSPHHEADVSEAVSHKITTGALTYERFVGTGSHWSVYGSTQHIGRDSYYGANQSLKDYGYTEGLTFNIGTQFKSDFGNNTLLGGVELVSDQLEDTKLGAPDFEKPIASAEGPKFEHTPNTTVADQASNILGFFAQYDRTLGPLKASVGFRFDHYDISDKENGTGDNSGSVFSPRVNLLWTVNSNLQWRASYSQGYRAPQIFDEDLHILTSGSRRVIHENDPNLKQETSHSWMSSLDFNKKMGLWNIGFLTEAFYTQLNNPFFNEPGEVDENGTIVYTRINAEGAQVQGVNLELTVSPLKALNFKGGYTIQSSRYSEAQAPFNERRFFRTPDQYGFFTLDWDANERICLILNGTYTGEMLVPYLEEELRTSPTFMDMGIKAEYAFNLSGLPFKLFGGVKNMFNAYQDDFDSGMDRDPAYMYGPTAPRTVYFGIKLSNLL